MHFFLGYSFFVLAFLLGIAVGSFLNVVILRKEEGERVTGRSHCMSCGVTLHWSELIPVVSYLLLLGRCKYCKARLSPQYPVVEFVSGLLFVFVVGDVLGFVGSSVYVSWFTVVELLLHVTVWALFLVIAVYDFRTKLIPDVFSFSLASVAFALLFVAGGTFIVPSAWDVLAGPALFLPFYVLWKVSKGRWLGLGDGKLALGIGWYLGLSIGGSAIMLSFWIGAIVSVGLMLIQHGIARIHAKDTVHLTLKSEVPFGPFMVLGTVLAYIFHINLFINLL